MCYRESERERGERRRVGEKEGRGTERRNKGGRARWRCQSSTVGEEGGNQVGTFPLHVKIMLFRKVAVRT